jgi:hypothetical protein
MAALKKWDITAEFIITATFDAASVNANSLATQNVTVSTTDSTAPLMPGDRILAIPPATLNSGLSVKSARYVSATQVGVTLDNNTGGALDAASGTWEFIVFRGPDA